MTEGTTEAYGNIIIFYYFIAEQKTKHWQSETGKNGAVNTDHLAISSQNNKTTTEQQLTAVVVICLLKGRKSKISDKFKWKSHPTCLDPWGRRNEKQQGFWEIRS